MKKLSKSATLAENSLLKKNDDEGYSTATTSKTVESASEVNRALNSSSIGSSLFKLVLMRVTSGPTA